MIVERISITKPTREGVPFYKDTFIFSGHLINVFESNNETVFFLFCLLFRGFTSGIASKRVWV